MNAVIPMIGALTASTCGATILIYSSFKRTRRQMYRRPGRAGSPAIVRLEPEDRDI